MKTHLATPIRALAFIAMFVFVAGCSKSTTTTEPSGDVTGTTPAPGTSTTTTTTTTTTMGTLVDQIGGMSNVNALADAFAANLSSNATLSAALNADAINSAKQGLVNEIAKASGAPEPYPGANLLSALSGKVTTADGANAVTDALSKAADSMNLNVAAKSALTAMMAPITKSLVG